MKDTKYFAPTEVGEAVQVLAEHGDKVSILAGGTDLVPQINYYEIKPEALMFIGGLGLDYIKEEGGKIVIGATTTTTAIAESDLLEEKAAALVEGARASGSVATRNTATIGGNIGNASPAADLVIPLMAMDAELLLKGPEGERTVALNDYFLGPHETARKPNEFIVEISFPVPKGKTSFIKIGRRKALTFSIVNVAVQVEMDGDTCQDVRIALGAVAPTPILATEAMEMLKGQKLDEALLEKAGASALAASKPIDDQRARAYHRQKVLPVVVKRALAKAAGIELAE